MHASRTLLTLAFLSGTLGMTAAARAQTATAPANAVTTRPAPLFVTASGTVVEDPNWVCRSSWQRLLTVFVSRPKPVTTQIRVIPTRIRNRRQSTSTSGTTTVKYGGERGSSERDIYSERGGASERRSTRQNRLSE